jgi:hypothetical protein
MKVPSFTSKEGIVPSHGVLLQAFVSECALLHACLKMCVVSLSFWFCLISLAVNDSFNY